MQVNRKIPRANFTPSSFLRNSAIEPKRVPQSTNYQQLDPIADPNETSQNTKKDYSMELKPKIPSEIGFHRASKQVPLPKVQLLKR